MNLEVYFTCNIVWNLQLKMVLFVLFKFFLEMFLFEFLLKMVLYVFENDFICFWK